jgi:hypothetical protein
MAARKHNAAMAKKALPKRPGRDHELVTKAIYEALLTQDEVKNLDIRHDVKIQGTHSQHQIDVYWKIRAAGIEYKTIVQVKKDKRPTTKGDIHTFEGVLNDIPGQPRGVFVTRAGYQSGALKHARGVGILLLQLSDVTAEPPITMTTLSFARMEIVPDKLEMRTTVYNVKVTHIDVAVDWVWAKEVKFPQAFQFERVSVDTLGLLNDVGQPQESLHDRVQSFAQSTRTGGKMLIEFKEPTFITGFKLLGTSDFRGDRIKVVKMKLFVEVAETVRSRPFSTENFVTYVLKNVINNDQRYVMVERGKDEPRVIVSFPKTTKNIV